MTAERRSAILVGTGWQTLLADLSIILFMIATSVVARSDDAKARKPGPAQTALSGPSAQSEPLALYRDEPGAPPLGIWLAGQTADTRMQLTIVAHYAPGARTAALARAESLARDAGAAGLSVRIVVEPGPSGVTAALAYDVPQTLARSLL